MTNNYGGKMRKKMLYYMSIGICAFSTDGGYNEEEN